MRIPRGTITAIVGPSGIGKSTLCRAVLGEIEIRDGELLVDGTSQANGVAPNPHQVSFVPQDTQLTESLTVIEVLTYASRVRNAHSRSENERIADVGNVMNTLGISGLANREVFKLSGGEKKRVSIAQELVTKPLLLILDEPSSGLDEGLDRDLMSALRQIASSPELPSVLVVTHATNHLDMVDYVCAIGAARDSRTGAKSEVRYFGPPTSFLESLQTHTFAEAMNILRATPTTETDESCPTKFRHEFRSKGVMHPLRALLRREWALERVGLWKRLLALFSVPMVISMLLTIVNPKGLGTEDQGDNSKILITITMLVLLLCFWALYKPTMRVVADWPVTRREQRWGISARLHLLARFLFDLPQVLFVPVATIMLLRFATTRDGPEFSPELMWHTIMTLSFTCLACYIVGLVVGAVSKNAISAMQLMVGIISTMIVFSGALFHLPDVRELDVISNLVPSRLAIAELASSLDVSQARGATNGLDPKFYSSIREQTSMLVGIFILGGAAFIGAMTSVSRTMRKLDRKG